MDLFSLGCSKLLPTLSRNADCNCDTTVCLNFSEDQSSSNLSDNKASQGSDDDDDEDDMVTEALQFNQLSLEEYCVILLARVVPMFRGSLCAETGIIESAVNSLHGILSLTKRVFPPDLWRSETQLNSLMVCKKTV